VVESMPPWLFVPPQLVQQLVSSDNIVPGADYVVSGYSTTTSYAVMQGLPGSIYLLPPTLQEMLIAEKDMETPYEAQQELAWVARSSAELAHIFQTVDRGWSCNPHSPCALTAAANSALRHLVQHQQHQIKQQGGNAAQKVWSAIAGSRGTTQLRAEKGLA